MVYLLDLDYPVLFYLLGLLCCSLCCLVQSGQSKRPRRDAAVPATRMLTNTVNTRDCGSRGQSSNEQEESAVNARNGCAGHDMKVFPTVYELDPDFPFLFYFLVLLLLLDLLFGAIRSVEEAKECCRCRC